MNLLLVFVASAIVAFGLWVVARPMFAAPVLQRTNHRGAQVPVAAGVVLLATVLVVEAMLSIIEVGWEDRELPGGPSRTLVLILALGFGLLGAFDDLAAHGDDRGFRGHLRAMARGSLSTGGLKLVVGGLLAIIVVARTGVDSLVDLAVGAALVALAANLGNLFDRAPGRTTKVALLCWLVLLVLTPAAERDLLVGIAMVLGAGAGLLLPDLREEMMLGDAGANVLGAVLGLGVVLTVGRVAEVVAVVALLGLNLVSEKVSFSRVIATTPPLRALDLLGRRPPDEPL